MPKCPKCKEEISHLTEWREVEYCFTVENDKPNRDLMRSCIPKDEYECPECCEILFTDEAKAIKFLTKKPK